MSCSRPLGLKPKLWRSCLQNHPPKAECFWSLYKSSRHHTFFPRCSNAKQVASRLGRFGKYPESLPLTQIFQVQDFLMKCSWWALACGKPDAGHLIGWVDLNHEMLFVWANKQKHIKATGDWSESQESIGLLGHAGILCLSHTVSVFLPSSKMDAFNPVTYGNVIFCLR